MTIVWEIEQLELPLKYDWKIARNNSQSKINFIVHLQYHQWKGSGEIAPNIRYGETPEQILDAFNRFKNEGANSISSFDELDDVLAKSNVPNSLRFGIESAFVHMISHSESLPVHEILGIAKPEPIATSYSFPIMPASALKAFYDAHALHRFQLLKLKVNASNCMELIETLAAFTGTPFIVDANESFTCAEDVLDLSNRIAQTRLVCIEQPMPAALVNEYQKLKPLIKHPLIADESICRSVDFNLLESQFHGVNVKLMKTGGYFEAISILNQAHERGMITMLGCMIETTLGISSAMQVSNCIPQLNYLDLDGFMVLKDEPFGLVTERDGVLYLG
jgi:L-alanine-DL-glutamate epimerase-like enolase superfamily enzyme